MQIDTTTQQDAAEGFLEPLTEARIVVYGEPVVKARPRTVRNKVKGKYVIRTYTPEKTKKKEEEIAGVFKSLYGKRMFEKEIPLRMVADFYIRIPKKTKRSEKIAMAAGKIRPTKKIKDTDNLLKCASDALNGIAYYDDSQIVEMTGRKFYGEKPRTEIYISRFDNEAE